MFEFAVRSSNGGKWVESTTAPVQGIWYFIVGTYDSQSLKIYINGTLENSASLSGFILPSSTSVDFGRRAFSQDRYFEGKIDEVSIWDKALSSSEIAEYYEWAKQ